MGHGRGVPWVSTYQIWRKSLWPFGRSGSSKSTLRCNSKLKIRIEVDVFGRVLIVDTRLVGGQNDIEYIWSFISILDLEEEEEDEEEEEKKRRRRNNVKNEEKKKKEKKKR